MGTQKKAVLVFLSFILAALSLFSCDGKNGNGEEEKAEEKTRIPIEVGVVEVGDIAAYFSGTATLEAEQDAQVVAKVSGVVTEILVEEGDFVDEDRILARLDGEVLSVQLAQAEATLQKIEENFRLKAAL